MPPPQMLNIFEFCIPYLSVFRKTKRQFKSIMYNDIVFIPPRNHTSKKHYIHLDKLLRIRKKYGRLITFSSYTESSKNLFTQLNILTIYSIHKIQLATHMYKILHKLLPDHSTFSFPQNSSIHAHNTRFNQMLHISYSRTKLRNDTMRFQGPKLWNSPPFHLGECERLCIFKRQLRIFIMKQQYN